MKLTHKTEYAILALLYLARLPHERSALAQEISDAQGIPKRFLHQILNELRQSKYVKAFRGKGGGYTLLKPAGEITIAEVIRLFDGPLAPTPAVSKYFYSASPIEREPAALDLFRNIRDYTAKCLEHCTIGMLIAGKEYEIHCSH